MATKREARMLGVMARRRRHAKRKHAFELRRRRHRIRLDLESRYHVEVTGYYAALRDPNDLDGPMLISVQTEDREQLERAVGALVDAAGTLLDRDRSRIGKADEIDNLKAALLDGLREMHRLQDEREDKRKAAAEKERLEYERRARRHGRIVQGLGQFEDLPDGQTVGLQVVPRKKGKR